MHLLSWRLTMAIIIDEPMPKACYECNFRCGINFLTFVNTEDKRHPSCPIIGEIPDEHGRLVDADKILTESGYDPMMFQPKYGGNHRTQYDTLMGYEILGIIEDAPTVVEATEIHTAPPAPIKREHCRYYAFSSTAICGEHEYCLKKETYNFECSKECPYCDMVVEASK